MSVPPNEYYQYSLLAALGVGLYDGHTPYSAVARHGDFGLGTFDRLDGELIANEGEFWQMKATGEALQVELEAMTTPYAAVTRFVPEHRSTFTQTHDFKSFTQSVMELPGVNPNCIVAIRLTATFDKMVTRTVCQQTAPYKRLVEVTKDQKMNTWLNESGVLVGFYVPDHLAALAVRGFHLHFLSTDKSKGGHVLDFVAKGGSHVEVATLHKIVVEFPETEAFKKADLGVTQAELLRSEGGPAEN